MPIPFQAQTRIRQRKRALRGAINQGLKLTPEQVKRAVAEADALFKTITELTAQSNKWPSQDAVSDREINALMKRADELTAQFRARIRHPQISAVFSARQAKAEAKKTGKATP